MQSMGAIEFCILTGIDQIKTCCPEKDCQTQQTGQPIQRAAYRNPCAGGSNPKSQTDEPVAQSSEPFCEGVKKDDAQRDRRQQKGKPVELIGREDEQSATGDNKNDN